jgi:NDP-sugar pyrophosphorylase family protein
MAAVVLAAGAGERLRPLTRLRPKALCPVANQPLVDHALERVAEVTPSVAVNIHHGRALLEAHLAGRVHLSIETDRALGTAGALGLLRPWIDGRPTLVVNADAWSPGSLRAFTEGWDGERPRLLVAGEGAFGPRSSVAASLLPWAVVQGLPPEPSGLYELVWGPAADADHLDVVAHHGPFVDCGTPARYLAANLQASGGASVIGPGAEVEGAIERCVLWPGARVGPTEHLVEAIRTRDGVTLLVR